MDHRGDVVHLLGFAAPSPSTETPQVDKDVTDRGYLDHFCLRDRSSTYGEAQVLVRMPEKKVKLQQCLLGYLKRTRRLPTCSGYCFWPRIAGGRGAADLATIQLRHRLRQNPAPAMIEYWVHVPCLSKTEHLTHSVDTGIMCKIQAVAWMPRSMTGLTIMLSPDWPGRIARAVSTPSFASRYASPHEDSSG